MILEERITRPRIALGLFAFMVGCVINYFGDRLLGVRIELFWGLETFNFIWFLQLFILPVLVGIAVGLIFRRGGKWLAMFPPLAVRWIAYMQTEATGIPDGAALMPMGWWGFFVILAMECASIGGLMGEIWSKRAYGRSDTESEPQSQVDDAESKEPQP